MKGILNENKKKRTQKYQDYKGIRPCPISGAALYPGTNEPVCHCRHSGQYFPDHYAVSIEDESYLTPADIPVGKKLEYGEMFPTESSLLQRFAEMGYPAHTLEILDGLLEDTGIEVHRFQDPYSPNN